MFKNYNPTSNLILSWVHFMEVFDRMTLSTTKSGQPVFYQIFFILKLQKTPVLAVGTANLSGFAKNACFGSTHCQNEHIYSLALDKKVGKVDVALGWELINSVFPVYDPRLSMQWAYEGVICTERESHHVWSTCVKILDQSEGTQSSYKPRRAGRRVKSC